MTDPTNHTRHIDDIRQLLVDVEQATTPAYKDSVYAQLNITNSDHRVLIGGASNDEYQQQGSDLAHDPIQVKHMATYGFVTVRSLDDETVVDTLRRALDFVATETPVPA